MRTRTFVIRQQGDNFDLPSNYPTVEADYVEYKDGAIHFYKVDSLDVSLPIGVFVAGPNTLVVDVTKEGRVKSEPSNL